MRLTILIVMMWAFSLSGCNRPDKGKVKNDDAYSDYEIADPSKVDQENGPVVHTVEIVQMKFVPEVLNIHEGDTVVWVNRDLVQHDVTELGTNSWRSSPMAAGSSWKMTFINSQLYQCSLHVVMRGKIIVDGRDIAMTSASSEITMCNSKLYAIE